MYRAFVDIQPWTARAMIYIQRPVDGGAETLCTDGQWRFHADGTEAMSAGIPIPIEAVTALAEALHPHAGHKVEVKRLEEALTRAEGRVDSILEAFLEAKSSC